MPGTPPSSIATGRLASLFDSTLSGAAAIIDTGAAGVAQTSLDLLIFALYRTSAAAESDGALLRFNNDSGANYDHERVRGTDATVSALATLAATSFLVPALGNTALAAQPSVLVAFIPSYAGTTFNKTGLLYVGQTEDTAANLRSDIYAIGWRNTAAISRISLAPSTGPNFVAGSRMVIYGIG